jgi:Ulp1 family protease
MKLFIKYEYEILRLKYSIKQNDTIIQFFFNILNRFKLDLQFIILLEEHIHFSSFYYSIEII